MKSEFAFQSVIFSNARVINHDPVAAAVRKTTINRVSIRISHDVAKKCAFKEGDMLVPFLDVANRAVLLLSGQRPVPASARKLWNKKGSTKGSFEIEFPRTDGFDELFDEAPMRGMVLREASHGRLVFTVPKITKKP
jgi:hypothetical protein